MSKVNRLNNLLTHTLPINNLCMDSFKVFKVWILPLVKVICNGGNLRCHMAKIPHCEVKILISKDGLLLMGPPIDLPFLLTLNYLSWLHLSFHMYHVSQMIRLFIHCTSLWCHPRYQVIAQSSMEKLKKILKPMWWHITSGAHRTHTWMIPFIFIFSNEPSRVLQQNGTSIYLEVLTMTLAL